jgi:hypothetical protein
MDMNNIMQLLFLHEIYYTEAMNISKIIDYCHNILKLGEVLTNPFAMHIAQTKVLQHLWHLLALSIQKSSAL